MTLLYLPPEATVANYPLLAGDSFYKTRNKPVLGIVLHITAGLQDIGFVGTDESAEGTIKWAVNSGVDASWHAGADTDGVELCLPDWYTAWHAKGYNSPTVGIEISKLDTDWSKMSARWVEATLRNAARYAAAIVVKHKLPLALATKAQVDAALAANRPFGFTYHSYTSPDTRTDPGKNFPWSQFIGYVREYIEQEGSDVVDIINEANTKQIFTTYPVMINPVDGERRTPSNVIEEGVKQAVAAKAAADSASKKVDALAAKVQELSEKGVPVTISDEQLQRILVAAVDQGVRQALGSLNDPPS